jgi:hypothetical protein
MLDSASVVSTANGIAQAFNLIWPVITSILAYIVGHRHTQAKAKKAATK